MLNLNTIFGAKEQMLPQEGFAGFLLNHWLLIAVLIMVLGFLIDQVLYVMRYRPQDKWKSMMNRFTGRGAQVPADVKKEPVQPTMQDASVPVDEDAPVIRRGGARYAPAAPSHVQQQPDMQDADAPMVVRAATPVRSRSAEPNTKRGE